MPSNREQCIICSEEEFLSKCQGCLKIFCSDDLEIHRLSLGEQLTDLENNIKEFQECITEQSKTTEQCPLIQKINQWEQDSLIEIKQAAEKYRNLLTQQTINDHLYVQNNVYKLIDEIRIIRQKIDLNENHLSQLKLKYRKLVARFTNSPDVFIEQDSTALVKGLSICEYSVPNISQHIQWCPNGVTIAGGNGSGTGLNQLSIPHGISVDYDKTVFITGCWNNRIVEWKSDSTIGKLAAGGNGRGDRTNQLDRPTDVLIDKTTRDLIICDRGNKRVLQWPRLNDTKNGTVILSDIDCYGLAMDNQRYLYVSDDQRHEVRRYKIGDSDGILVAGGGGQGDELSQLNSPTYLFVDSDYSVYVSDHNNHRIMKWPLGASQGTIVAGGHGEGNALTQLSYPSGVYIDSSYAVYVADSGNDRIVRWPAGATQGTIIAGGNGLGSNANQFYYPIGISFDQQGSLYVVDWGNHRLQKFSIETA